MIKTHGTYAELQLAHARKTLEDIRTQFAERLAQAEAEVTRRAEAVAAQPSDAPADYRLP